MIRRFDACLLLTDAALWMYSKRAEELIGDRARQTRQCGYFGLELCVFAHRVVVSGFVYSTGHETYEAEVS